ncbi:hypothetical protein [Rhodococcus globerulus]|uniref:hypothetical protein n=1 Tax=Rhodococcus globerulus TaxID=33008 RepID=UPI00294B40EF|nr:hypothetical protein [Rhodococcus globerulus]
MARPGQSAAWDPMLHLPSFFSRAADLSSIGARHLSEADTPAAPLGDADLPVI